MADKELTRKQINRALSLLSKDPDKFPLEMLSAIVHNLGQLEPYEEEWAEKRNEVIQDHIVTDEEGNPKPIDEEEEDVSPTEMRFGVRIDDEEALWDEIDNKLKERVEVTLRTVDINKLKNSDKIREATAEELQYNNSETEEEEVSPEDVSDMAILRFWHFMV